MVGYATAPQVLRQVYPVQSSRKHFNVDVVFVHGLDGDSVSTWTKDETFWPRDLLPKSPFYQDARIFTFGYNREAFLNPNCKSKVRTFTCGESLLNDLDDARSTSPNRPIIFIGHSLGGIVIKYALKHAKSRSQFANLLKSTHAIIFFSTPHQGTHVQAWNAFFASLGKADLQEVEVVEELKQWSDMLAELTSEFGELAPAFQMTTFYEFEETNGVLVVPEGSARMGQQTERLRGLNANHTNICKFTEADGNWLAVSRRLEAIAQNIGLLESVAVSGPPTNPTPCEDDLARRLRRLQKLQ
ncbi:Alpha/Beta hydrolase protein [Aspergillus nidulans var. acristatus]